MATDLQFNVTALDKATATFVKLAEQVDRLSKKIDKLDGKKAEVKAEADTKRADAGLDGIERKVKNLDGKKATVKVDVDKSIGDSIVKVAQLGRALRAIALPTAAIVAAPQIAAIGAAVVQASGAIGILPGVAGAAALAIGTLKVGFSGFGDAMKAAGDPKKFAEAIKDMSPAARATATELRDLVNGPLKQLRQVVQEHLFAGMANEVKGLAATYLPALQSQMQRVASVFNVAGRSVFDFFQKKAVASDLTAALNSLRLGVQNVVLAARPLAQVFVDVFSTSAARIPALTQGLAAAASKFAGFISAARQSGQLRQWIDTGIQTVKTLGQVVTNVGSILLSVFRSASVQGANLVQTLADVTAMAAAFLKSVQGQQALTAFFGAIRAAVDAIKPAVAALLPLFADLVKLVGNNLVAVFQALGPPLQQVAAALSNALRPVLPVIVDGLRQIALAMVPMIAQAQALTPAFHAIAQALAAATQVAVGFFSGMATTGIAAFKAIVPLITAAAEVLTVLLHVIEPIAPAIGAVVAAFLVFKAASSGISAVQGIFTGLAKTIAEVALNAGTFTAKVTGSTAAAASLETAGLRLSTALGFVSAALPVIAVAAAAVAFTYDQMRDKSDELASSVVNGQMAMSAAVAEQTSRLQNQAIVTQEVSGQTEAMGQGIGELTGQLQENSNVIDATTQAYDQMTAAAEAQLSKLPPLEQAQQRVRFEEERYTTAVQLFGQNSPQARAAQDDLSAARQRARDVTQQAADAEKSLGDRIAETQQKAAAAANADIAYQQGLLSLADASDRAAEAARNHAAGSDEVTRANLAVQQASLSAAEAAGRKAQADAEARGASDAAAIGAQAYKDELQRQADTLTGPAHQAALDNIALLGGQKGASDTARTAANLYKGELQSLADKENGPLKDAILGTIRNFDNLGGAHATAEQRAAAQRAALVSLAAQAQGPTRDAILAMIRTIDQIHDKSFTVSGTGVVNGIRSTTGSTAPGAGTRAAGGIIDHFADGGVTPGYTPGRDVHRFRSATGGTLDLSGGEAVMRPEWTRVVTPGWVHAANRAARTGGIQAVEQFLTVNPPGATEADQGFASGGIIGGRYASGGVVLRGVQPFSVIPQRIEDDLTGTLVNRMVPILVAQIKAAEAAAIGGAPGAGTGMGWQRQMAILRGAFPGLALISGYRPGAITATGNRSYHASGRAVDVPPRMDVFNWIRSHYGASTKELIFSPAGMAQIWNGRPHMYTGITRAQHFNHVHWAMRHGGVIPAHVGDRGGTLPHGTAAINMSGGLERVLPPEQTRVLDQILTTVSGGGRASGGDGAVLIAELQTQNRLLRALRGDVDQTGSFNALIGEIRGLRYQLAAGGGSAGMKMQADRTASELGAWL